MRSLSYKKFVEKLLIVCSGQIFSAAVEYRWQVLVLSLSVLALCIQTVQVGLFTQFIFGNNEPQNYPKTKNLIYISQWLLEVLTSLDRPTISHMTQRTWKFASEAVEAVSWLVERITASGKIVLSTSSRVLLGVRWVSRVTTLRILRGFRWAAHRTQRAHCKLGIVSRTGEKRVENAHACEDSRASAGSSAP
jgi:hypothetical protein